jgi:hypothetical protein
MEPQEPQLLEYSSKSPIDLHRGFSCFTIRLFYKSNLGAPENSLAVSESTLLSSRGAWKHSEEFRSIGEGYRNLCKLCVSLSDLFTFCGYWLRWLPNLICRSSNSFLVGFQHVCKYGKARRSCTARTVWHAPCLKHCHNEHRRVSECHNRGNTISEHITSHWSLRREEVGSWVSWQWKCGGCGGLTLDNASGKSNRLLHPLMKWIMAQCPDMLQI